MEENLSIEVARICVTEMLGVHGKPFLFLKDSPKTQCLDNWRFSYTTPLVRIWQEEAELYPILRSISLSTFLFHKHKMAVS